MSLANEQTAAVLKRESIWSKAFVSIFIVNITMSMAQFMMGTLIPKYVDQLGASATVVGIVTSMFAITALGIRPIGGPAISYFRKNRLLAVALGFITLAFVIYGFAGSIPLLIIGRLFHGIGMGLTAPICLALASDALPESRMASGIGVFSLAQAIATAVGPSVGLKLAETLGFNTTFFIGAVMMSGSMVLTLLLKTNEPARTEPFRITLDKIVAKEAIIPAVMMFFLGGAYSCLNSFIVIYGGLNHVDNIGLFFTAYAVCLLISRPFSGRIADKYGLDKVMIPGMIIFALSFVCVSFSHSLPMFLLSGAISAFGYGICQPSMQTLCMRVVPKEKRGLAGNTNYIGVDLGFLLTPALAGTIVTGIRQGTGNELLGYMTMYRVMIIPILIALAIFIVKRKALLQKIQL